MAMNGLEAFWDRHYRKCVVICYWLLGLCNNFAYVIMLSAAHDILGDGQKKNSTTPANLTLNDHDSFKSPMLNANKTNKYDCNDLSTGTILIADIVPGIISKLAAPFFMHKIKYSHRVFVVVLANFASFLLVALVPPAFKWLIFIGVGFASFGSSFGEITFLSMTTLYDRQLSITGWASGTGAAGFIGINKIVLFKLSYP
jgi:battenin